MRDKIIAGLLLHGRGRKWFTTEFDSRSVAFFCRFLPAFFTIAIQSVERKGDVLLCAIPLSFSIKSLSILSRSPYCFYMRITCAVDIQKAVI